MYAADVQPVLRCKLCNKPFDQEFALKRHGYYCKSRKVRTTPRSRSCLSCARAKTRCDSRRPECSRCLSRGIQCHYPAKTIAAADPKTPLGDKVSIQQKDELYPFAADPFGIENGQEADNLDLTHLDPAFDISGLTFEDIGGEYLSSDIDFIDVVDPPETGQVSVFNPLESSSLVSHSASSTVQPNQIQRVNILNTSIPAMPSYIVRSFHQRSKFHSGAQRTANLIIQTLKSYPIMMMRDKTLPPFIHPHLASSDVDNNYMEPLSNCVSLVHMLASPNTGGRKLFWKNVQMECERLCAQYWNLGKQELLAAMQALSVYILIRLDEGERDYNNFDSLLITTVTVLAIQFNSNLSITNNPQSALYSSNAEAHWTEWILNESARRLCVVYQIVNMLIYFDPAAMCDLQHSGLLLAPLPAKQQLWEAGDAMTWKVASDQDPESVRPEFALATNGDLVKVGRIVPCYGDDPLVQPRSMDQSSSVRVRAEWKEFCAGMDGLGALVMLAASLVA